MHCRQRAWSRHWILSSRTPSRPETSQIARMALLCPRRWRIATSCWNWPPRVEYSSCARQRTVVTRWWIIHHRYRRFFRFHRIYTSIFIYIYNEIGFLSWNVKDFYISAYVYRLFYCFILFHILMWIIFNWIVFDLKEISNRLKCDKEYFKFVISLKNENFNSMV